MKTAIITAQYCLHKSGEDTASMGHCGFFSPTTLLVLHLENGNRKGWCWLEAVRGYGAELVSASRNFSWWNCKKSHRSFHSIDNAIGLPTRKARMCWTWVFMWVFPKVPFAEHQIKVKARKLVSISKTRRLAINLKIRLGISMNADKSKTIGLGTFQQILEQPETQQNLNDHSSS